MLTVNKLGQALGAEIRGINLAKPIADNIFESIVSLFHEHSVIIFKDQKISPEQQIAFSKKFGEIDINVRSKYTKPGYPEIFVVSNIIENGQPIGVTDAGRYWHTDHCYVSEPSRCSLLYAIEVPILNGVALGDTMFASVTAAYEALPEELSKKLDGLKAINSYNYTYNRKVEEFNRTTLEAEGRKAPPDIAHPVIRTHPFTGKKCIFVNEGYTTKILGLPDEESKEILKFLFQHVVKPDFAFRHHWEVGDLLLWDNCSTQHKAVFDYSLPLRRKMERTTIRGSVPY